MRKYANQVKGCFVFSVFVLLLFGVAYMTERAGQEPENPVDALCEGEAVTETGVLQHIWTYTLDGGVGMVPIVSNGVVVTLDRWANDRFPPDRHAKVIGVEMGTGTSLWTYASPLWIKSVSVIDQHVGFVQEAEGGRAVVLSLLEGEMVTNVPMRANEIFVTPRHLYTHSGNRETVVYSITTGQELVLLPPIIDARKQFAYLNGRVYSVLGNEVSIFEDDPFSYLSTTPLTRWGQPATFPEHGLIKFFVFEGHFLALFSDGLTLYQVNGKVEEVWSIKISDHYSGKDSRFALWPPAIESGHIYLFSPTGQLMQIALATGQTIMQVPISDQVMPLSPPVAYRGKLYAVFTDGTLRSFALPSLTEAVELQSTVIRHYENERGQYHALGTVAAEGKLLVSFGCKNLYAFQAAP